MAHIPFSRFAVVASALLVAAPWSPAMSQIRVNPTGVSVNAMNPTTSS